MRPQKQKSYHQRKHFKKKFNKKRRPITFDQMLRQFKKKCERSGVVAEVRERQYYEKPSSRRQKKINAWKRKIKIDKIREEQALEAYKRSGRY